MKAKLNRCARRTWPLLLVALVSSCKREDGKPPAVARFGAMAIEAKDIEAHFARLPPGVRTQYASAERRKELLHQLVDFALLAGEAERRGLGNHPEVMRARKQQMITLLTDLELSTAAGRGAASDEDLQRYYQEHYAEFHREDELRVSEIVTKGKGKAAKIAAAARAARRPDRAADEEAFRALVATWSEDAASKARGGDVGVFGQASGNVLAPIREAALRLQEPGDVSDPVSAYDGFHILKLLHRRAGFSRPFVAVKEQIRQKLLALARKRRMDELAADLRKATKVEIDEKALADVRVPQTPSP